MGPRKGKVKKKKSEPATEDTAKCKVCNEDLDEEADSLDCDVCSEFICLKCTAIPHDVYNLLVQKDLSVPFICDPCKQEIPKIRELMGLKQKYESLQSEVTNLRGELETQDRKFEAQQENMNALMDRLKSLEDKARDEDLARRLQAIENRPNQEEYPDLLDTNSPNQPQRF